MVREAAAELAGRCAVVQVNTEESRGVAGRFHIGGIPTVIFFRKDKALDTISGALDKEALVAWCKKHLA